MDIIINGEIITDSLIHEKCNMRLQNYHGIADMIINDFTKLDIILQVVSGVIMYIIHEFGDDHEII
jgi:hypothetical protein